MDRYICCWVDAGLSIVDVVVVTTPVVVFLFVLQLRDASPKKHSYGVIIVSASLVIRTGLLFKDRLG